MKIWTHLYALHPGSDPVRAARGPRRGALVKIQCDDGATGYGDLHPWIEFGHSALEDHLASLASEKPTSLAEITLRHARTDASARHAGVSLFDGLPEIRSHALFTNWAASSRAAFEQCAAEGYDAIKLKIGRDPERAIKALNTLADLPLRWRLDANGGFAEIETLTRFITRLAPALRANIEFIEDPCDYDPAAWSGFLERVPLALDWKRPPEPPPWPGARMIVIKPASQDAFPLAAAAVRAGMEIVVTHSMDHPLGQAAALWTAMRLRKMYGRSVRDGGLQAEGLYQPDDFSAQLRIRGPLALPPPGTGFGFDELLAVLLWVPLV